MTDARDYNGLLFMFQQFFAKGATSTLVKVLSFTPASGGGVLGGVVSVQPLVNQVDPAGNATPHGEITGVPYFRFQAGTSAIIIDPVPGDIGFAGFCSRDISTVKATAAQGNPGSFRQFSMSDAIYFGGIGSLNGAPTEFVKMSNGAGIEIMTSGPLSLTGGGKTVLIDSSGVTIDGKLWETHTHGGVQAGGAETGPPV